jgi:tryptophanyl-tRNA synthetase
MNMMKQETFVAGCRASGKLHIGNYLGLVKDLLESQKRQDLKRFYFIADLHGLTTPFEKNEMKRNTLEVAASYLAAGIDPNQTIFFLQSHVQEHATLAWIFNCITPLGELERMTQYKDKSSQNKQNINAGLLTYPTLMAADILLYKPTAIPVGEDQVQHVELSRVIARKFNNHFGKTFPEPQTYMRKPLRVMSLTDPAKKMSKTGDEALLLDDEPKEIHRKLKKAVTASDSGKQSLGVENLFLLLENFGDQNQIKFFRQAQREGTLKFSEFKDTLAEDISEYFAEFRDKKKQLMSRPEHLAEILGEGSRKAQEVANQTLQEVKEKIGLL